LSDEERDYLGRLVSTGTNKARRITRARILLLADESKVPGKTDKEVSKTRERFVEERLEALNEKPRPDKKPKLSGRDEVMLTAIACGEGALPIF